MSPKKARRKLNSDLFNSLTMLIIKCVHNNMRDEADILTAI